MRRWPEEHEKVLAEMYGTYTAEAIAARLFREFGTTYTEMAVWRKSDKLGLHYTDAQGLLTIREAARQLDVCHKNVLRWLAKLGIKATGRSPAAKFLDEKAMERLRAALVPTVPTVSVREAGLLLGLEGQTVTLRCKAGKLAYQRRGNLYRVERAQLPSGRDKWGRGLPGIPEHLLGPRVPPVLVRVVPAAAPEPPALAANCPACGGPCVESGMATYLVTIERAVHRWRCPACKAMHRRYGDGTIHEPMESPWGRTAR